MLLIARGEKDREGLVRWLAAKAGTHTTGIVDPFFRHEIAAFVSEQKIKGVAVLTQFRSGDAELVCAGEPGWLSRVDLRDFFTWAFGELELRRITAIVHKRNKASRRNCLRLGMQFEGVRRQGAPDGDTFYYGMLGTACPWLKGAK